MEIKTTNLPSRRRGFLRNIGNGAAALGLATVASSFRFSSTEKTGNALLSGTAKDPADEWFDNIKGKHRVVYDATRPHEIMPFVWPKVFLMTNEATGTPAADCSVVVVLRHDAIPFAMKDEMWEKYHFADMFKVESIGGGFQAADAATALMHRNPFYNTKPGDFMAPGFGAVPIGIKDLQKDGVMFCVCNAAMTVYSAAVAMQTNKKAEDILNEWRANVIPGIEIVPSGVWALGRAQEHGCGYIFAG